MIKKNKIQNEVAGARLTVSQGESARGILPVTPPKSNFVISVFKYSQKPKENFSALIVTTRKNEHSIASRVKSISYLDNILSKQEAIIQGYDEAILLNTASNVADGAITNVFMIKNGLIYTPPITDGALPGVVRSMLLENFHVIEKSISTDELLSSDEVFLTNALMGIQPVSQINEIIYYTSSSSLAIAKKLREVKNYI